MLLSVLKRQRVNDQPECLFYTTRYYIGSSPYLSSIICVSTSDTVCSLLVDLLFPSFVYNFDIIWFILYFVFVACITLLDDLFFLRHLNTSILVAILVQAKRRHHHQSHSSTTTASSKLEENLDFNLSHAIRCPNMTMMDNKCSLNKLKWIGFEILERLLLVSV